MIIYLEGADGTGKSTLTHKIVDYFSAKLEPVVLGEPLIPTKPKDPGRLEADQLLVKLCTMLKSHTLYVLDRGPISDCVYRIFDEYKPVMQLVDVCDLFNRYKDRAYIIYCHTPLAEKYMLERGDDNPVALARHREITAAYNTIMPMFEMLLGYRSAGEGYLSYDFNKPYDLERVFDVINYHLFKRWRC